MRTWVALLLSTLLPTMPAHADEAHWVHVTNDNVVAQTAIQGEIDTWPVDGGLQVRGWVVDTFSATRPDRVEVTDQTGLRLGRVDSGEFERRHDVELRFGSSAYALSGFQLTIPRQTHDLVVRAHLGALGWWWASVATALPRTASVTRLECVTPDNVEVELHSTDPFPVRNAILELHTGSVTSAQSRYGPGGDLHTVIFTLTAEQFAQVSDADAATAAFNPGAPEDEWLVGPINSNAAIGC